ncbi:hypothetical protein BGX31_003961, partial [Mortierella sp. GBA43]
MVEHATVTRLFNSTDEWSSFDDQDTWTLFHSYGFDFSVWEMWGALRKGGKLLIISQDIARSSQDLYRVICNEGVTVLSMATSAFKSLIAVHTQDGLRDKLRYVIFGGEAWSPTILQPWYATHEEDKPIIVNMYGPTETTVFASYKRIFFEECSHSVSPLGRRLADLRAYVLDKYNQPVPIGAVGELHVGGAGVTRGYLNRPELTAEKFIPDPFAERPNARMYKTGDMVRYLPDGNMVYISRNDHQVKIRGFRIELGEIEARLGDHPSVVEAVVIAMGDANNKRLVAYVVTQRDEQPEKDMDEGQTNLAMILRSHLVQRLPEYMVPSAFVRMEALPLNANGKLDQRALPKPGDESFAREAYEEPQGEVEQALASIWSELLNVDQVSRNDSFFALGGHSLLAVRMMNRINALGINLPLSTLFNSPSLSAFAQECETNLEQGSISLPAIDRTSRDDLLPLSFAQQRLWFLSQLDGVSDT